MLNIILRKLPSHHGEISVMCCETSVTMVSNQVRHIATYSATVLIRNLELFIHVRGAIQNYVDFCCRMFILQPITSCFPQNNVLS